MSTLTDLLKKVNKKKYKIFDSPVIKEKQKLYSPNLSATHKKEINTILITMINQHVINIMGWKSAALIKTVQRMTHPILTDRKLPLATYVNKHIIVQLKKNPAFVKVALTADLKKLGKSTITNFFQLETTMDQHPIFHEPKIDVIIDTTPDIIITDPIKPTTPVLGSGRVNKNNELIAKLSGLSVDEKSKFTTKHQGQVMDTKTAETVFSKTVDKGKLTKINFAKGLLDLTKGDEQLTEQLFKTPGVTSLKSVAKKKTLNWRGIIEKRYGKKLSNKEKLKKADELEKEVADSFPTDFVTSRVSKTSTLFKKFLADNDDLDVFSSKFNKEDSTNYNWKSIPVKDQPKVKKEIQTFQRTQNLTNDVRNVAPLINAGYTSANSILSTNRQEFYKNSGLSLDTSKLIYEQALEVNNESLAYLNMQLERYRDIQMPISNTSEITTKEKDALGEIDYQEIFGSLHFCECSHCNSVLSPAAYFVDLLYFLKTNNAAAFTELTDRRADLLDIQLNCDQTNTTQPYLELVNEVLGKYLENNVPNLPNLSREIDEILYLPWVNPELPFEEDCMRARLLAEQLDTSLFDIYSKMEATSAVQMAEYLGLGPETLKWMFVPDPLPATSIQKYPTETFLKLFNLDYDELNLIVNASIGSELSIEVTKIDTQSYTEKIVVNGASGQVRAKYLKKLFKFLRLYRHLNYELTDLELYVDLASNETGVLNAVNLAKLSTLMYAKDALELDNDGLTILIRGYEEDDYGFSSTKLDEKNQLVYAEVLSLIGITEIDFEQLVHAFKDNLSFSSKQLLLDVKNLSLLKRNIFWANGAGLSIKDWLTFLSINNNLKLVVNNNWIELINRIKNYLDVGVPISLVDFYVNDVQNESWYYTITEDVVANWITMLKDTQTIFTAVDEFGVSVAELLGADDQLIQLLFEQYPTKSTQLLNNVSSLLSLENELDTTVSEFTTALNELKRLDKNIQLLDFLEIDVEALNYFYEQVDRFGINPANTKLLLTALYNFSKWLDGLNGGIEVFEALFNGTVASDQLSEETKIALEDVLELDANTVQKLLNTFGWKPLKLGQWNRFFNAVELCSELNWSAEKLEYALQTDLITDKSREYYQQLSAFFDQSIQLSGKSEDQMEELYSEVNNELIEAKRDAIVALVKKSTVDKLNSTSRIYAHFLLDSEMSACAEVSPIKAAILSIQLFIHRCLLNVENDNSGNKLQFDEEAKKEWEWRKNYRVWEANRKVFLYPENYLDPNLRDDKTFIYEELEGDLQQRDLTLPAIEKTYRKYLKEFSNVAKLTMAGSFKDNLKNVYYYFGRTDTQPYQYYYKTYAKSSKTWSQWNSIGVNISSDYLAGIIVSGRTYVFWKDLKEYKSAEINDGYASESKYYRPVIKYAYMEEDLNWSKPIEVEVDGIEVDDITAWLESLFGGFLKVEQDGNLFNIIIASETNFSGYTEEIKVEINIPENKFIDSDALSDEDIGAFSANSTEEGIELFVPSLNITEHHMWNANTYTRRDSETDPIITSNEPLSIINGQSSNNYIVKNGEKYYQYLFLNDGLYPLNSYVVNDLSEVLFMDGIDTFLNPDTQNNKTETSDLVIQEDVPLHPNNIFLPESGLDFDGPNGIYFQELYFHIPFTIAKHYNNNSKYEEADYWFKKIFDPTIEFDENQKYWQYTPFRTDIVEQMKSILQNTDALSKYHEDPFNPHAIARLRTGAYPKAIVMSYIDNLLDWGDSLFSQDTYESINEAMMLYITAHQLLGERPRSVAVCETANEEKTFKEIEEFLSANNEILIEIESVLSESKIQSPLKDLLNKRKEIANNQLVKKYNFSDRFKGNKSKDSAYNDVTLTQSFTQELFCIPWNEKLMGYWDLVDDRMYKIRNCLNIDGEYRQLALFEPPIDPNMLVRARAAGLNLSQLTSKSQLLPYRFSYLLEKARQYVNTVHSFGQAMLSAIEKENAEALNELRAIHENNILEMVTLSKEKLIDELNIQTEINDISAEKIQANIAHYQELLGGTVSGDFKIADQKFKVSMDLSKTANLLNLLSSALYLIPQLGAPTAMTYGGKQSGDSGKSATKALIALGEYAKMGAEIAEKYQNQNIRNLGWKNGLESSQKDLETNEKSKLINEIKLAVAQRDLETHEQRITQNGEVLDFYSEKMSNEALYNYLNGHLTRLYRDAYGVALQTAMDAQAAYQFETGNTSDFYIAPDNWDSASMGLLATEKLQNQLMLLERAHMEQNSRKAEIRSHVSMAMIDAQALVNFKNTGTCDFSIPEEWFDIQYPGQYKRRIKSVSISIPCVTGPYINVPCKLKLQSSRIRVATNLAAGLEAAATVPDGNDRIFTSSAQNDAGLLEFSFRDERYLPFEGAGVDSVWNLQLPNKLRSFNYNTISDVIFHISYTAEYDGLLGEEVEENIVASINALNSNGGLVKVMALKQEFPNEWHKAITENEDMEITLTENHFSYFTQGGSLSLQGASLEVINTDEPDEDSSSDSSVSSVSGALPKTVTITIDEEEKDKELFLVLNYKL